MEFVMLKDYKDEYENLKVGDVINDHQVNPLKIDLFLSGGYAKPKEARNKEINLEAGKYAGFEMKISIRPYIPDTEKRERDKKITADMNTNYLIERTQELFVKHGFDTKQFKLGGGVDIDNIGKASYKLIPIKIEN